MKSASRNVSDHLQDILDAIEKADQFTQGIGLEEFEADDKTIFAVVRALEIIGEASKKIPQSLKKHYASIPWREMTGIRDKLIHDYFGVNLEVVWKTVQQDLPFLKPRILQMLDEVTTD